MARRNTWKRGDWLGLCDRCGFTFYASELRREWTGLMVCADDWEERHPQDYLPSRADNQTPPWTRPEPTGIDVSPGVSPPGCGIGCMIVGLTFKVT